MSDDNGGPKQVAEPLLPQDDIGPFYEVLGALTLIGAMALAFLHAWRVHSLTWIDAAIIGLLVFASIALIRPTKFDLIVKQIAGWLPFFKYRADA